MSDMKKTHRSIQVRNGEPFVIDLEANPTTGYQWNPSFPAGKLRLVQRVAVPASAHLGTAGVERFTFEALESGEVEIRFDYKRAWEASPIQQQIVLVHVS